MNKIGEFNYDNLFSGDFEVVTDSAVAGETLERGTVVGVITETNEVVAVNSSVADGSEKPYAITADNAEVGEEMVIYLTGEFNANVLIFGGEDTTETHKRALREQSIFIKENVKA